MPGRLRVVLADDHAMVRQGLAEVLKSQKDILVVGEATDGVEAARLAVEKAADVAVLDYSMPHLDGPGAAERILAKRPHLKVIIISMHDNVHYALRVLRAGARGYILKSAAAEQLVSGIREVAAGKTYISAEMMEKLTMEYANPVGGREKAVRALAPREFQLLGLLSEGKRLQDCAAAMHVSGSTASTYRARLLKKLHLQTTGELIRFALKNKLES